MSDVLLKIVDNSRNFVQANDLLNSLQASDEQKKVLATELGEYYKDTIQDSYSMVDQLRAYDKTKKQWEGK